MKKILLAFDGNHFSEAALEFARQLNDRNPILLTAAFLPQVDYANLWSYSGGGNASSLFIPLVEDEDAKAVQQNIERLESFCIKHHIEYRIHKDFLDLAIPALKKESRYADLLIFSSNTFFEQTGSEAPNEFLNETLHEAECPVIVIPEKFNFPTRNILSYDGSKSSVYAIKQFACLFPELSGNETVLVYAKENSDEKLPEERNIEELSARHFSKLTLFKMDADPEKYFRTWLLNKKGAIIITGSYGRSGFSRLLKKSFAASIIHDHQLPVFIAHS